MEDVERQRFTGRARDGTDTVVVRVTKCETSGASRSALQLGGCNHSMHSAVPPVSFTINSGTTAASRASIAPLVRSTAYYQYDDDIMRFGVSAAAASGGRPGRVPSRRLQAARMSSAATLKFSHANQP